MTEENLNPDAAAGGEEFKPITTQEQLNKLIGGRIEAVKAKFADYDDIKAKASEFDNLAEANKTELQKALDRAAAAEQKAAEFEAKEQRTKWAEEIVKDSEVPAAVLRGSTREELEEHFTALSALVKPSQKRIATPSGKPAPGEAGGSRAAAALRELRRG